MDKTMSRMVFYGKSHHPCRGHWFWALGHLRRRKDGFFKCCLHPLARIRTSHALLFCPKCREEYLKPPKRVVVMSRTRAARVQTEE